MNEIGPFIEVLKRHDRELRVLAYRLLRDRTAMDDVMRGIRGPDPGGVACGC